MAACRRVYDSRHAQADYQEPGSAPEPLRSAVEYGLPLPLLSAESVRESGGKVLVYCRAGISRSAAICIAYLMQHRRCSMDEAHDYVKSRRTFISPNLNFMRQLQEFDARLTADRDRDGTPLAPAVSSSPSRPVLRSLQCPPGVVDHRRRWLSVDPDSAAPGRTARRASAVPARCSPGEISSLAMQVPAALLSVVSPGFRLGGGSVSAPTAVPGEPWSCRRERPSAASTPSQTTSRRAFVYPLPLNVTAKTGLVSL